MHLTALLVGLIACVAIIVLGARCIVQPHQATLDFGIAADNLRGLTEIKGVRDITSGVVPLVAWASAGRTTLGWVLVAAVITPTADALIVLTNGGKLSKALGVHGLTAALLGHIHRIADRRLPAIGASGLIAALMTAALAGASGHWVSAAAAALATLALVIFLAIYTRVTSGTQRLVSYLVSTTPSGNVRVSSRFRFTQLSRP